MPVGTEEGLELRTPELDRRRDAEPHEARAAFGESKASREVQDVLFDARAVLKARSPWRA